MKINKKVNLKTLKLNSKLSLGFYLKIMTFLFIAQPNNSYSNTQNFQNISNKNTVYNYSDNGNQYLNEVGKTISVDSFLANFKTRLNQKDINRILNMAKNNNIDENQIAAIIDLADKQNLTFPKNEYFINIYQKYLVEKKKQIVDEKDLIKIVNLSSNKGNQNIGDFNKILFNNKNLKFNQNTFKSLTLEKDLFKKKFYSDVLGRNINFKLNSFLLDDEEELLKKELVSKIKQKYIKNYKILNSSLKQGYKTNAINNSCINMDIHESFLRSNFTFKNYKTFFPVVNYGVFQISNLKNENSILTPNLKDILVNLNSYDEKINKEELYKNLFTLTINDEFIFKKITFLQNNFSNYFSNLKAKSNNSDLVSKQLEELSLLTLSLNESEFNDFIKSALTLISYNSLVCLY